MVTKRCLPWMFSINTNMSNEQGQEKSDSEEQCFVSEAIWCSEHSWSLRRISLSWRWWIVASYRKGTVEISNRKESGGGGGGVYVLTISFLYSKRWWSLLCCWWHEVLHKLYCLPAPVGVLVEWSGIIHLVPEGKFTTFFLFHSPTIPSVAHGSSYGQG